MDTIWRRRAYIVGYVDIVISSIAVLFALFTLLGFAIITDAADNPKQMKNLIKNYGEDSEHLKDILKNLPFFWAFGVSVAVLTVIQMGVSIMLVNSTEKGKDYKEARKKSGIWQTGTLVILGIHCFQAIVSLAFVTLTVTLVIRGIQLYVVWKFRDELEVVRKSTFLNPDYVITSKE